MQPAAQLPCTTGRTLKQGKIRIQNPEMRGKMKMMWKWFCQEEHTGWIKCW